MSARPFVVGDRVIIPAHRDKKKDGSIKETFATVTNPHDPTDMRRLDGAPVGHYVRVKIKDTDGYGYHESSLEHAP